MKSLPEISITRKAGSVLGLLHAFAKTHSRTSALRLLTVPRQFGLLSELKRVAGHFRTVYGVAKSISQYPVRACRVSAARGLAKKPRSAAEMPPSGARTAEPAAARDLSEKWGCPPPYNMGGRCLVTKLVSTPTYSQAAFA